MSNNEGDTMKLYEQYLLETTAINRRYTVASMFDDFDAMMYGGGHRRGGDPEKNSAVQKFAKWVKHKYSIAIADDKVSEFMANPIIHINKAFSWYQYNAGPFIFKFKGEEFALKKDTVFGITHSILGNRVYLVVFKDGKDKPPTIGAVDTQVMEGLLQNSFEFKGGIDWMDTFVNQVKLRSNVRTYDGLLSLLDALKVGTTFILAYAFYYFFL